MGNIDDHLLKAYALWGKNRVEFNRDGRLTLITFVWNQDPYRSEKSAIHICVGGHLMVPAQGFAPGPKKDCYELTRGATVDEIIETLKRYGDFEIRLHEKM